MQLTLIGLFFCSVFSSACDSGAMSPGSDSNNIEFPDAAGFALVNANASVVSAHSYNSANAAISVTRFGDLYAARFEDLGDEGGIAQVVAFGTDNIRCQIRYVEFDDPDTVVWYICHDCSARQLCERLGIG